MKSPTLLTLLIVQSLYSLAHATESAVPASHKICEAQVLLPAVYRPQPKEVVVREPSTDYQVTPPELGSGEKKVKIADGYVDYAIIPPVFKEVTETVVVERERVEIVTLPPTYRTETQRVKVKEASQRWNPACPPVLANTGDVPTHCLIEVPAEYREVTRQAVELPARTVKKVIPARTETIARKVLVEPAKVVRKETPP